MSELSFSVDKPTIDPLILATAYVEVLKEKVVMKQEILQKVEDLHGWTRGENNEFSLKQCVICQTNWPCETVKTLKGLE